MHILHFLLFLWFLSFPLGGLLDGHQPPGLTPIIVLPTIINGLLWIAFWAGWGIIGGRRIAGKAVDRARLVVFVLDSVNPIVDEADAKVADGDGNAVE